jgi:hypothetical protein
MSSELIEDVRGLPGDIPSDIPYVLSMISRLMEQRGISWCVLGDVLLTHYRVPKVTGVRIVHYMNFRRQLMMRCGVE